MEKYKILFSPIGKNDPISDTRIGEGSFLQLVRYLKPDMIYLFMTGEISERESWDSRNENTLKRVCSEIGINPDYEIINDSVSKEESHKFDVFYKQFENKLNNIREEYPDADIYLNVSSGTTAIKSALNIIAGIDKKYIALQVEDPSYDETRKDIFKPTEEEKRKIDELREIAKSEKNGKELYDYLWEINRDRTDAFFFRVKPSENLNFISKIKKEMIKEHLDRYNYNAASIIVEGINNKDNEYMVSSDAKNLIKAAEKRLLLDIDEFNKIISEVNSDKKELLLSKESNIDRDIYEYIMNLEIKLKKKEYADFIRAISPILTDLFIEYIKRELKIDICKEFCEKSNGIFSFSEQRLKSTDTGKRILKMISKGNSGKLDYKNINAAKLVPIIEEFGTDRVIVDYANEFRFIESKLRNSAAHEIVSINEKKITDIMNEYSKTGKRKVTANIRIKGNYKEKKKSPYDIVDMLKTIAEKINVASPDEWDAYDKMNTIIKELL